MQSSSTYTKVSSYEGRKGEVKKVVLLYSGGLDTSVMLKWIQDEYKAEVIALTIDIGQQADDLEEIRKKALKLGAIKAIVIDAKAEFAYQYIARGIKANASYQGKYRLATSMGRPLLAKEAVRVAREEQADCIAHGCTGKGNDQVRIEGSILTLAPEMKIIAPVREWSMGRDEELEYARKNNVPVKQTKDSPYSYDDNMWGVSAEGGEIENPALVPPLEKILQVCRLVEKTPNKPELVKIRFIKGLPVELNGKVMRLHDLITHLNKLAAKHGVGVVTHTEDRLVGLKIRNVYEAPAAETIINAHYDLEKYVSTRMENEFKATMDSKWAYLCYGALWYEPLMDDINAYIEHVNEKVSGVVTMKLFKGVASVEAIETPNTIFDPKLATFMKNSTFNQNASAGFIELYTLQMRLAQDKMRYALLSIGEDSNKKEFLPIIQDLQALEFHFYATEGTYRFLKKNRIPAILVHKMYKKENPSLESVLREGLFDLIINVPYHNELEKAKTDGTVIREWAIKTEVPLLTRHEVARKFVDRLKERMIVRKKVAK
jgi:argininosuccinate synthase